MNPYRDVVLDGPFVEVRRRRWPLVVAITLILAVSIGLAFVTPVASPIPVIYGLMFVWVMIRNSSAWMEARYRARVDAYAEQLVRNFKA